MQNTVASFGILNEDKTRQEWLPPNAFKYENIDAAVSDFIAEVENYPDRIQRLELFGS